MMIIEVMADWEQRNLQNRFLSFAIHGSIFDLVPLYTTVAIALTLRRLRSLPAVRL